MTVFAVNSLSSVESVKYLWYNWWVKKTIEFYENHVWPKDTRYSYQASIYWL